MQDEIKRKYLNPTLLLYTYRGCIENSLMSKDIDTATNLIKTDTMNEVSTIEFDIPFSENRKISYDDCEKLIKFDDEYYIIKNIEVTDDSTRNIHVKCEHESTELKGKYCECVKEIGQTPEHIFNAIFNAVKTPIKKDLYKWKGTDVEPSKYRRLITEDESSIYQNLISMAEVFNGWIEITTDENEQKWVYLRTNPINNGKILKKDLDMKSLGITYDSTEIFTQLYGEGSQDEVTGNPITIMSVNPTGKSYLENYSWYVAKGVPLNVIDSEPKYQQLKKISDDTYTSPSDLMSLMEEELKKCSVPTLDATLTMSDLSVYLESTKEPPTVGCEILCIDKQINFIFQCRVTGVERDYNNPLETKIDISNLIRYDTSMQNINHTIDTVDKVTSTNPIDTDGNATGDGKPHIGLDKICDGDHWNSQKILEDLYAKTIFQANQIALKVEQMNKSYAELNMTCNSISSVVEEYGKSISKIEQNASSIVSTVESLDNTVEKSASKIEQYSDSIKCTVYKGEFGSVLEQNPRSLQLTFNKMNKYFIIDDTEGLQLGDRTQGTYSKVGYNGKLEMMMAGEKYPYHCLTATGTLNGINSNDADESPAYYDMGLPNKFKDIPTEQLSISVSIAKSFPPNGGGQYLAYGSGCWWAIKNSNTLRIYVVSTWREYDDDGALIQDQEAKGGYMDVQYTITG